MSNSSTFVRKIIYVAAIAILLIPLSLISRPAIRASTDESGKVIREDKGGKLSQLRDTYSLSQAKLMEIDPTSETMKLASVGLRGVAVNMLWMQAMEHRKKQNWDQLRSTLNALIKIQPNFIKVWEYQAHNLSYNISVEFDDYEYRYHWVKEGIKFLTEGIPYNYRNHRITDNLGFFTGMKIGRSDEKLQFRRLFRKDKDFHDELELDGDRGIEPESYDTREYGHDNWKLAYQWYNKSEDLVSTFGDQYLSDMMLYRKRPMQLMNQARGLQEEFATDDVIQEIWRDANREWREFGEREIRTTTGLPVTFRGLAEMEGRLRTYREKLDELVPGRREELMEAVMERVGLSEAEKEALQIPTDERTEEQSVMASKAESSIQKMSRDVDQIIADSADPDKLVEARNLHKEINRVMAQMQFSNSYAETVNYQYWDVRSEVESQDITAEARRSLFTAKEMKQDSVFDDEYQFDAQTKEKKVIKEGAISLFDKAFGKWSTVMENPALSKIEVADGELVDDLLQAAGEYYDMLRVTGREWPVDFPFQSYIDSRAMFGDLRLPTSQDIADRESGRSDGDPDLRIRREKEELAEARKERAKQLEAEAENEDRKRVEIYDGPDDD